MRKIAKIVLLVVVMLLATSSSLLADNWFGGAAPDDLWTTPDNWWPIWAGTDENGDDIYDPPRAPLAGEFVGHDAGGETLLVQFPMMLNPSTLMIGDWGPGPAGAATFRMTGGMLSIDGDFGMGMKPYEDWGDPAWANFGNGEVNIEDGTVTVGGNLIVGEQGIGACNLLGGSVQAEALLMGTVDLDIALNGFGDYDNVLNITGGKLILAGNILSLESRAVAYGGAGMLAFDYEADLVGYTTITAIPEPATLAIFSIGCMLIRRKRA